MNYLIEDKQLKEPFLKLDGEEYKDYHRVSSILSQLTNIKLSKISFFIKEFGLSKILDEPSLMGITTEQEILIKDLRDLLLFGED